MRAYFEAVIGAKDTARAAELIKSRLERKTGQRIYETKVAGHFVRDDGEHLWGIMMMFADGKRAIRINWRSSDTSAAIDSVDFWARPARLPQFHVDASGLGVAQVVGVLDDLAAGAGNKAADGGDGASAKLEAVSAKTFQDVRDFFEAKGYSISKDPSFTVRRYLVSKKGSKEQTPIRFIPTMDEMYEQVTTLGVEKFVAKYKADSASRGAVTPAVGEQPAPVEKTPFDDLFERPFNEEEVFGLLDKGISNIKNGVSKTLIITGDPGIGKCVHSSLDLPCQIMEVPRNII